jgi:hypothetical protein
MGTVVVVVAMDVVVVAIGVVVEEPLQYAWHEEFVEQIAPLVHAGMQLDVVVAGQAFPAVPLIVPVRQLFVLVLHPQHCGIFGPMVVVVVGAAKHCALQEAFTEQVAPFVHAGMQLGVVLLGHAFPTVPFNVAPVRQKFVVVKHPQHCIA